MSDPPPHVRLCHAPIAQGENILREGTWRGHDIPPLPDILAPSLLLSYHYYKNCASIIEKYVLRDWVLDSGAFSAMNSGVDIDLDEYIEFCHDILKSPVPPVEIFSLDVIGDAEGTKRNTEKMWDAGIEAIPAYHIGEPEEYLLHYAATYPKIALGGVAMLRPAAKKSAWAKECFARVWPKKIHGFGFGTERDVLGLPFHSTDSTNWEMGPCAFGVWRSYSGASKASTKLPQRGSSHNLRGEVEWYLNLERRARARWRDQMEELDSLDGSPVVRLAIASNSHFAATFDLKEPQ